MCLKPNDLLVNQWEYRQHARKPPEKMVLAFRVDEDIAQLRIFVGQR
jgi:N6-adenosine-specific RNA methylase IME4